MWRLAVSIVVLSFAGIASPATHVAPPPKRPPVDCHDADHRAIGFWVGAWSVIDTGSSTPIADSRIEWMYDGCAIRETYTQTVGPGGKPVDYRGSSYTALNNGDHTWRQFYIDSTGGAFSYTGDLNDATLTLTTRTASVTNRMTIKAQADGSVRQSGEISTDGGKTWSPGYDFTYRRK
ncbi:MAG TPA: hypothetical protein VGH81_12905 [Rudaea sp.]|jgi:hypothetical protein